MINDNKNNQTQVDFPVGLRFRVGTRPCNKPSIRILRPYVPPTFPL